MNIKIGGKCTKAQLAAALRQTDLNVFKVVIMCKMTPPSMQISPLETAAGLHRVCALVRT